MEVPDKVYIDPNYPYEPYGVEKEDDEDICYIRKDALLEWAKENRDSLGRLSYGEFLDKLNSI